jgi:GTPase SAR1 family protein
VKLCVIGQLGIGKTSLISKYLKSKKELLFAHLKNEHTKSAGSLSVYSSQEIFYASSAAKSVASRASNISKPSTKELISDIEKLIYLYKDEFPIETEIWDTVGQERFNEEFTYS